MKGPLAVNHLEMTQALFQEGAQALLSRKYNLLILRIACIMAAVWAVMYRVFQAVGAGDNPVLVGELFLFAFVLIWIRFVLPKTEIKRAFPAQQSKGSHTRETVFYPDQFTVFSNGEGRSFQYSEVLRRRLTKHLLILTLKNGAEVMLDRDGFREGSLESVLAQLP